MLIFWERVCVSGGGRERKGDTEFEAGSRLSAVSTGPNEVLEPMNHGIMTWAKVGRSTDWDTQEPLVPLNTFNKEFQIGHI